MAEENGEQGQTFTSADRIRQLNEVDKAWNYTFNTGEET